jgi:hypothetical protein
VANSILTIDMITRKALQILENNLVVTRNVNRQYDDSFAKQGAKIGSALRIRLPDRVLVTDGPALQVQDDTEQFTTLNVTSQKHVGVNFTTAELTLSLDDFADRVLKPRMSQLAASIDTDVCNAYRSIYNAVGTPGTTPGTSLVLLQAQQRLNEFATPMDQRYGTVNPAANAALVEGMKGFFNPQGVIADQFKKGMMDQGILGYEEFNMSQSIKTHTTGTRVITGSPLVNGTITTEGTSTINIDGVTTGQTLVAGDIFTIANVFAVNPQTRESTGSLQQFVVTALNTAASSEYSSIAFSPAMYTPASALATVSAFPADNAAVTFLGAPSTQYPQNLVYHKNAITFATADLVMPEGVDMASRQNYNGISMRIVRQYDINNDRMPCRIDVLYGYAVIRAAMACRIYG